MTVSIAEIAKKAGVSKMTVSRVINQSPNVHPATRDKILKIIQTEGYQVNRLAQNLSKGNYLDIAAVITGIENLFSKYYFTELIRQIETYLDLGEHSVFIFNVPETDDVSKFSNKLNIISEYYHSKVIKGVIILGPPEEDKRIQYLSQKGVKGIAVGSKIIDPNFGYIDIHNEDAAYQVTEYLIKQGHQEIAIINGPAYMSSAREREEGYLKALKDNQIKLNKEFIAYGEFDQEGGRLAALELLKQKERPTAIFATNDDMALGVYAAAKELGIHIPKDLSVVGFDDMATCQTTSPQLSSVAQPYETIGKTTAEYFMKQDFSVQNELPAIFLKRSSINKL